MPFTAPVRLDNMMSKGYVQVLKCGGASTPYGDISPPKGHVWLVLGGWIYHCTGYVTGVYIYQIGGKLYEDQIHIINETAGATGSMGIPLFAVAPQTGGKQSQWCPLIITDEMVIRCTGDEGAFAVIQVLEWKT